MDELGVVRTYIQGGLGQMGSTGFEAPSIDICMSWFRRSCPVKVVTAARCLVEISWVPVYREPVYSLVVGCIESVSGKGKEWLVGFVGRRGTVVVWR